MGDSENSTEAGTPRRTTRRTAAAAKAAESSSPKTKSPEPENQEPMETDIEHNDGESLKAKAQENTNENPIENKPSDNVSENQPETEEKEDASSEEQKDGVDDEKGVESNEIISKDIENNEDVLGDKIEENVEEDNEIPAEKRNEESLEEKVDDEKSAENDGNEKTVDDKTGSKNSAEDKDNEGDTVGSSQVTKENGNAGPVIKSSKDTVPELEEEPLNGKPNVGRPTLNLTAKTKIKLNKLQKEDDDDEDIIEVPVIKPKIDVIDVPDEEIGDTEVVSEDELPPPPTKEKVDGAEEVSDEELPAAPKPDLPPEAEDVSDEELAEPLEKKKKLDVKIEPGTVSTSEQAKEKQTIEENRDNGNKDKESEDKESNGKRKRDDDNVSPDVDGSKKPREKSPEKKYKKLPELEKYWKTVKDNPTDFTGWTYLLQYVDQESDIEAAEEAYSAFLSHYPYCYGYWRKYADYEKKKGTQDKCEEVFVQGLKAIPLSVDLWIHFLNYIKSVYAVDPDYVRQQYKASVDTCGLEFRADRLWDSYIKWEISQKELVKAREVFDRVLSIPLQGHTAHFESFQNFVGSYSPKDILPVDEFLTIRMEVLPSLKKSKDSPMLGGDDKPPGDDNIPPGEETESTVLDADEANAIKEKIVAARRKVHKETASAVAERWSFEEGIKRPYFHVKALEKCQLKNWKDYLDFEISKGNEERILVLFERCLIACALYEEFWYKYICYLVDKPTPDVEKIREIYIRACTIHHPKKVNLHFEWAAFEEKYGYPDKAREILEKIEKEHIKLIEIPLRRIALEKRTKQPDTVNKLYEKYLNQWKDEELAKNYFDLAIKYARYSALVLKDVDKAVQILKSAIETEKEKEFRSFQDFTRLHFQLIDTVLHRPQISTSEIVSYLDSMLERSGLTPQQKFYIVTRKLEILEEFGDDITLINKTIQEFRSLSEQAMKAQLESQKMNIPLESVPLPKEKKEVHTQIISSTKKPKPPPAAEISPTPVLNSQPEPPTYTPVPPAPPNPFFPGPPPQGAPQFMPPNQFPTGPQPGPYPGPVPPNFGAPYGVDPNNPAMYQAWYGGPNYGPGNWGYPGNYQGPPNQPGPPRRF